MEEGEKSRAVASASRLDDRNAEEEAVVERVELLALRELVGGANLRWRRRFGKAGEWGTLRCSACGGRR